MIKIIAFDLVGVLVHEKDIFMTEEEKKIERLFGDNISNADYLIKGRKIIVKDSILMKTTLDIINKLYEVEDKDLFKRIKEKEPNVKIIIATNHVSYVRDFIGENFGVEYLNNIIISAEIQRIKPNKDFYEYILNQYNIEPEELLLLDDSERNILGAKKLNIKTIKVDKNTDIFESICNIMESNY